MKVTNPSPSQPLYATIDDKHFEILPGSSVDVDEREAMLLAEYGAIVDRAAVDEALETVFTPFSEHGPGTDDTGKVIDQAAQDAFVEAVKGDTSKTPAKVADLSLSSAVSAEPVQELVSSEAGSVDEAANADAAADAAAEKSASSSKKASASS